MKYRDILLAYLPQCYRTDPWLCALYGAVGKQADNVVADIDNLTLQMLMNTATWALPIYEKDLGIVPLPSADINSRRGAVEAKWKSDGKSDIMLLQAVADSWKNGTIKVSFADDFIRAEFISEYGTPSDMGALMLAMDSAKPAHLPIAYLYKYLLVGDIKRMTIKKLKTMHINKFAFGGGK